MGKRFKEKGYYHALPNPPEHYANLRIRQKTASGGKLKALSFDSVNTKAHVTVNVCQQGTGVNEPWPARALIDTGVALNFASTKFVMRNKIPTFNLKNSELGQTTNLAKMKVCSTLTGVECTASDKVAKLNITHVNTPIKDYIAEFIVGAFDDDIIIGRPTLAKYNLLLGYPDQFFNLSPGQTAAVDEILRSVNPSISQKAESHTLVSQVNSTRCFCHNETTGGVVDDDQPSNFDKGSDRESSGIANKKRTGTDTTSLNTKVRPRQTVQSADEHGNMDTSGRTSPLFSTTVLNSLINTSPELATRERSANSSKRNHIDEHIMVDGHADSPSSLPSSFSNNYSQNTYAREDIYEISDDLMESIPSGLLKEPTSTLELPTEIHGPKSLQTAIKHLIHEYRDIFSTSVSTEPADVTPFTFTVDERMWETQGNRTGARRYDTSRALEIKNTVSKLLAAGVIRPSKASYYSHGFVVPKSTPNELRFVVDYKRLNKISSKERWPLPNIEAVLRRIGDKKPKYFIVMDMTSGYHQAPIAEECRHLTAFMTADGLY